MVGRVPADASLVSIVMPTFNGRRYIASALASLQEQDYPHLEIIVIDDGSTDDTVEIVEGMAAKDQRISLVRAHHRGIAASRNDGLARARGASISFLDHDDLSPQGKISRHVAGLAREPKVTAIFGRTLTFSSTEAIAENVVRGNQKPALTMCLSAALFRRSAFDQVGWFDPKFELADDFDFILRLIEAGDDVAVEDEVATLHRRHPTQVTADLAATRREAILALADSLKRRRAAGNARNLHHPLIASLRP